MFTDDGAEYQWVHDPFRTIASTLRTGYTPEMKPFAEKINATLKEPARVILIEAGLPFPLIFLCDAMENAARINNRLPHPASRSTLKEKLKIRSCFARH